MKLKLLLFVMLMTFSAQIWATAAPWVGSTLNDLPCNGGGQAFGPYDYTLRGSIDPYNLNIVEGAHLTPDVENLIRGRTSTTPEHDLNYTLRAWPNHHRALLSIIRYQLKIKDKLMPGKLETPPECYLQRAIHFSPNDAASYSLFGYYLSKMGQPDRADKMYQKALELNPKSAKSAYSYSLLLIELKRYDEAVKFAKIAYQYGKPPKGLKNKLIKLNLWNGESK